MGCLVAGPFALLALAIPAAIAVRSLLGAYIVLAVLAGLALAGLIARRRQVGLTPTQPPTRTLVRLGGVVAVYAAVATLIHFVF